MQCLMMFLLYSHSLPLILLALGAAPICLLAYNVPFAYLGCFRFSGIRLLSASVSTLPTRFQASASPPYLHLPGIRLPHLPTYLLYSMHSQQICLNRIATKA